MNYYNFELFEDLLNKKIKEKEKKSEENEDKEKEDEENENIIKKDKENKEKKDKEKEDKENKNIEDENKEKLDEIKEEEMEEEEMEEEENEKKIVKIIEEDENEKKIVKIIEEDENKKKGKEENKIIEKEVKEKLDFVSSILNQFNYFPKYFFGFIYIYDTIYDLIFCEYNNIFLKLLCFEKNKTMDIYKINELLQGNNLIEKEDVKNHNYNVLHEDKYIEYLRYVPLKYINFCLNGKGELYFYYSFLFFKSILKDFFEYYKAKDDF